MRRAALALLALAVGGSALAQTGPSSVRGRVSDAVRTWTSEEILREFGPIKRTGGSFGGSITRTLPKVGRYVKWGGALVIGGMLVNDALSWLYNEAKRSTGTALDDWYSGTTSDYPAPPSYMDVPPGRMNHVGPVKPCYDNGKLYKVITWYSGPDAYGSGYYDVGERRWKVGAYEYRSWGHSEGAFEQKEYSYCVSDVGAAPLSDVLSSPGVSDAIKDAVAEYLNAHPDLIPSLLDPIPNANQLADDIVDPGLDTDGDGMTDGDELRRGPGVTTTPGNRPHPDDGPITDPSDSASKPVDTDGDGIPDWRDSDDDNDGVPDDEETPEGQKDKTKKPEKFMDTDGDGIPDDQDQDDDGDGWSDQAEETAGSDSKDKNDTPENKPCAAGEARAKDGMCKPEEDETDDDDSGNECGDFSVPRLIAHTGEYLRDVVFPCEEVGDILKPITEALKAKFPFSLAASLNGWFQAPTGDGGGSQLPAKLGIIPLDWGWLTPLWAIIKNIVGVALWAWFVYWLIDRFTPRAQI